MSRLSELSKSVVVKRVSSTEQLGAVKNIYREHKSTLGLMPELFNRASAFSISFP